ncbi:MAG TPA: UDP-N-acetylglucosamine 1-carboxyvinyltransferase [Hypericibacter adhaerens]|jgi:UDP-N-acetylglucosamine 1-carboxyvinyltransferase|uniref:UDP-N-acetylglucosamine 1-carboxyvinyltransferase n=1 Tax=Hypericibacter adhaerens TaxID=2602016 RepID=A0A5J6N8U1_9PROT|nr:UDP-N-acetylglucosamine 1-carboxyvinyltransferase [Hypericibacter adhaerens]QEX23756.1 UDP-N-acetylglucosamine 1-carboxyvinyltransferase [Hypericibacter adhaerens]HWA43373.1 UDP-N-acetylglucosamine 1-carboxyvinyltransferase [Hypericibacter adhaerens]
MDKIRVRGGKPLKGEIPISGAKNAALPLMSVSLLTDETLTLGNLPHLADITTMAGLLAQLGTEIALNGQSHPGGHTGRIMELTSRNIRQTRADYDLVRKMRASVLVLGPLLARAGRAEVSLPGGCAIGTRPIDLHLMAMQKLGAEIELKEGYVVATAPRGLTGGSVAFPMVSVGATENLMMAASLARGTTEIVNAAREPEIVDLAKCLTSMGAKIEGAGTDKILIHGVDRLHGARHDVVVDRIETGTYAMATAITGGSVELIGAERELIGTVCTVLERAGVALKSTNRGLHVSLANGPLQGTDAITEPFPGFPTDLQAQFMALMTVSQGAAMITETIFENRFMHVPELARMGANITVHGASAMVRGVPRLTGAPVMATDLRASVSLVMAGLVAEGDTILNRVYHLDRGYERLTEKLEACGADIERIHG